MTERRTFKLPGQSDSTGIICKVCGGRDLRVVNSYPEQGGSRLRRRKCRHCGCIVTTSTTEVVIDDEGSQS